MARQSWPSVPYGHTVQTFPVQSTGTHLCGCSERRMRDSQATHAGMTFANALYIRCIYSTSQFCMCGNLQPTSLGRQRFPVAVGTVAYRLKGLEQGVLGSSIPLESFQSLLQPEDVGFSCLQPKCGLVQLFLVKAGTLSARLFERTSVSHLMFQHLVLLFQRLVLHLDNENRSTDVVAPYSRLLLFYGSSLQQRGMAA